MTIDSKMCCRCLQIKDISHFGKYTKSKDGFRGCCKSCDHANYRRRTVSKIVKQCPVCGETKLRSEFYLRPNGQGTQSYCKSCSGRAGRGKGRAIPPTFDSGVYDWQSLAEATGFVRIKGVDNPNHYTRFVHRIQDDEVSL